MMILVENFGLTLSKLKMKPLRNLRLSKVLLKTMEGRRSEF
jgi:hypothetical protein